MRIISPFILLPLLAQVLAQERPSDAPASRHAYQSDVTRLRKIVIESLYSHRDVWLRELVSNANDAIEKWRVLSLKEGSGFDNPLNVTLKLVPGEGGKPGRIVITDTGIGMSAEDLAENLGTLAKSGTNEFVKQAQAGKDKPKDNDASLIGQFGLGFYSSFLVANDVFVASIPAPSKQNPEPIQHVFSSGSDAAAFDVYPDPRGNTLGRGTEITLILKDDATEYLKEDKIRDLITKHSAFSTPYPIYLWATKTEEVPLQPGDEGYVAPVEKVEEKADEATKEEKDADSDDVVVEDAAKVEEKPKEEEKPQTKTVTSQVWDHLNSQPPLWMRDPKNVTEFEYNEFFRATFKNPNNPIAYHQFKGDTGDGTGFRAVLFLPPEIPEEFWNSPKPFTDSVRLFVKRVFITNNLGESALPKWISWMKAIIDADDLPLNVSREGLQTTKFMAQAKAVLIKRFIQLMTKIAAEEPRKYERLMQKGYGTILKLGAVESPKDQKKLMRIVKFKSTTRDMVSLEEYTEKRKKGQSQIFYMAGVGETFENLAKSIFVEKLTARGYEVLLLNEPMDEILFANVNEWNKYKLQDVSKEGLKFGDEDAESDKESEEELKTRYEPLIKFLKEESQEIVTDVIISNRLVTSPCAIVANQYGYSGNMQRLISGQHTKDKHADIMQGWAKKQRVLEINPKSPLMEGLLTKVKQYDDVAEGEKKDEELGEELKEVVSILMDGALVRSGFDILDKNLFFTRVDRVLRRSLDVSETAKADDTVKPAPAPEEHEEEEEEKVEDVKIGEKVTVKKAKKVKQLDLPDLDLDENLADLVSQSDEAPFDTSKAVDIKVDHNSDFKVGVVTTEDQGSWENKLSDRNVLEIEKFLAQQDEMDKKEAEKENKHDEL